MMLRRTIALALALAVPQSAAAWDPSTTHLAITEGALVTSDLHARWMEGSGQRRGLFTPLRVDPKRLDPEERRAIELAFRVAHADSGALGLGGPGACPPLPAPAETVERCVEGDLGEMTALGWV
jgi:hypothetical protein